jgi:hypothetical protein
MCPKMSQALILRIPREIIAYIAEHLEREDVINLTTCCTHFAHLGYNAKLWETLGVSRHPFFRELDEEVVNILDRYTDAKNLEFNWKSGHPTKEFLVIPNFRANYPGQNIKCSPNGSIAFLYQKLDLCFVEVWQCDNSKLQCPFDVTTEKSPKCVMSLAIEIPKQWPWWFSRKGVDSRPAKNRPIKIADSTLSFLFFTNHFKKPTSKKYDIRLFRQHHG